MPNLWPFAVGPTPSPQSNFLSRARPPAVDNVDKVDNGSQVATDAMQHVDNVDNYFSRCPRCPCVGGFFYAGVQIVDNVDKWTMRK
jgi:hypothetical protein